MALKVRLIKGTRSSETELFKRIDAYIKKHNLNADHLAVQAQDYMRTYIAVHSRRDGHTGNLERNITVVRPPVGSRAAVYVGDKELLNRNAPYWYVLNYGATITGKKFIPPETRGFFGEGGGPISGSSGHEAFTYQPIGAGITYHMTPKTFTPINYIEATNDWLKHQWTKLLSREKI